MIEYLGYCVDANLSGESMAMKYLRKINTKLQMQKKSVSKSKLYNSTTFLLCLNFLVPFKCPGNEKEITGYSKQMYQFLFKTQLKAIYRS